MLAGRDVAIATGHNGYAERPPYSPASQYPEYPFCDDGAEVNPAYDGVRQALHLLGLDGGRFGTPKWNPLGDVIRPGETVMVKPNFVRDFRETHSGHGDCLITHGAVIRAAVDYVYIALRGEGRIIIADAPQNDADFGKIRQIAGLDEIQEFYWLHAGFEVEVYDLRSEAARKIDGVIVGHERLPGDPAGYVSVDLGERSAFAKVEDLCHLLYGAEYDKAEVRRHHRDGRHEYLVSRTVLEADCVINLPKLKTHKKTGLTACLKNLVGINGNKNWLPHHREGMPREGGDEFPDNGWGRRAERNVVATFKRLFPSLGPLRPVLAKPVKLVGKRMFGDTNAGTIRSGNWFGNDTTWRMVLDLAQVLMYADAEGVLHDQPVRTILNVVDGIIAGEGDGPLNATPRHAGVIIAGTDLVAVDLACARLMGFDPDKIPLLRRASRRSETRLARFPLDEVLVKCREDLLRGPIDRTPALSNPFRAPTGWEGHLEAPHGA